MTPITTCISLLAISSLHIAAAQVLDSDQINLVVQRLAESASHSWEYGTRAEALTELDAGDYSVFNNTRIPPPQHAPPSSLDTVMQIAAQVIANRSAQLSGLTPPVPLFPGDASVGDPASMGVTVLIANWTGLGNSSFDYASAATDQLNYLLNVAPKSDDGAISHRTDEVQLWSDFMSMAPPFIAYYGVTSANRSLLEYAYNQCKLYRSHLLDSLPGTSGGVWRHMALGNGTDSGHWSTGNGWAASGMLRVLATIKNSQFANSMKGEMNDLGNWVTEIHNGMYSLMRPDGLFYNYVDQNSTFEDSSSAALIASTVYRLAILTGTHTHLPIAEFVRQSLSSSSNSTFPAPADSPPDPSASSSPMNNMAHFTPDGWLSPVVDPLTVGSEATGSTHSPEGQAFVVMMNAAWGDWVHSGSKGANHAVRSAGKPSTRLALGAIGAVIGAITNTW